GRKAMHICPRCETPLSNFEVTQGYKDIDDTAVTWKFKLKDEKNAFVLAWTTTPWSTLSTMGLSIKPDATYIKVRANGEDLIMAKNRVADVMKGTEQYEVIDEFLGKKLVGKTYEHIASWYGEIPEVKKNPYVYHIFAAEYVDPSEGTGIVTINGSYGEIDMEAAKKNKLPIVMDVQMNGHFGNEAGPYAGMHVEDGEKKLIKDSRNNGHIWRTETYRHSYPHCWRCDSPLLNYATSSWFVAVEKIKEKLLDTNAKTEWVPAHIRDGRFGKWLEGARDWAISRNRFWGTPIPIWRNQETGETEVIGSRDDLMRFAPQRFTKLTVMRHAESEGNTVPIYQGKVPGTDLTNRGRGQAQETAKMLVGSWKSEIRNPKSEIVSNFDIRASNLPIDVIYCSPLARTQQTAQIVAKHTDAKVIVDERLREVSFGEYEGKAVDFSDLSFVKARRAHKLKTGQPESIYHFPGMEPWDAVQERISDFLTETLVKHPGEHILVVTHADPLQNVIHFFTQEDPLKLSHQPYPTLAGTRTFFWDHEKKRQLDLHKHVIDDITWNASDAAAVDATFVRHGETDRNKAHIISGQADVPLNKEGKQQIRELSTQLQSQQFDLIISSDLKRAVESAEILSKELKIPYEAQWIELRERNLGEYEGKKKTDVVPEDCPSISNTNITPKGGETQSQFRERVQQGAAKLLKEYKGKRILVVGHGGVIKVLKMIYLNCEIQRMKNADFVQIHIAPKLKRIPEVFDCWFESGSMPYAQPHFPFETAEKTPPGFPADFIAEGMDQTRGWFYTLMILSTALFNEPAFKNCVVNGIVLAEDGKKMSKRLKNYPEPMEIVKKYGADAVRFTLMSSPAVRGEDLRFSEKAVAESMRNVLLPLWNSYSFFVTYANAAGYEPVESRRESTHPLDIWIRAEMQDLVNRITQQLDRYELSFACSELHETIDALTNWYIRLSRRRFAGKGALEEADASVESAIEGNEEEEQAQALHTLYDVLLTMGQILAPFCPFIADAIYLNLVPEEHGSVHLTDWPLPRPLTKEEQNLLQKNRAMRLIVSLGHKVRAQKNLKVRQPLARAVIALPPQLRKKVEFTEQEGALLQQELNVKEIAFTDDPGTLAETIIRVDARAVGPRLGARVQEVIAAGKRGDFTVQDDGSILVMDEVLTPQEAQVVYIGKEGMDAHADQGVVVSMDTSITDALQTEGIARDLIRAIQRLRKEAGLAFTDHIILQVEGADDVLSAHADLIAQETRSDIGANKGDKQTIELGTHKVAIRFQKR
ncbi:MAG: histidine phosphatase family protein, partial [Candidatus Peribacteraceae bacterium]